MLLKRASHLHKDTCAQPHLRQLGQPVSLADYFLSSLCVVQLIPLPDFDINLSILSALSRFVRFGFGVGRADELHVCRSGLPLSFMTGQMRTITLTSSRLPGCFIIILCYIFTLLSLVCLHNKSPITMSTIDNRSNNAICVRARQLASQFA